MRVLQSILGTLALHCAGFLICVPYSAFCEAIDSQSSVGLSLAQALQRLQRPNFHIVFSSALVDDSLRVRADPQVGKPASMARELLAPYGLTLSEISPSLFAVVRSSVVLAPSTALTAQVPKTAPVALKEVTVTASYYRLEGASGLPVGLEGPQLRAGPHLADDALQAVERLPGVAQNGFSGQIHIRGGEVSETLLLLDGFPIRQIFHLSDFQGLFSALDVSVVKRIDVYTGGFPARYGNRMSGVLDIQTRDASESPKDSVGLSTVNASARVSGAIGSRGNLDGLAIVRVSTLQRISREVAADALQPKFSDALAKLHWHPADGMTLSMQFLSSQDSHETRDSEIGNTGRFDNRTRYAWFHAEQDLSQNWRSEAWVGNSLLASDRSGAVDSQDIAVGQVTDHRRSELWDARARFYGHAGSAHALELGGEWAAGDGDYNYRSAVTFGPQIARLFGRPVSTVNNAVLSPYRRDAALYASDHWQVTSRLAVEMGIRVQRSSGLGLKHYTSQDPRLLLSFALNRSTRAFASWGIFHQSDDVQDLDVVDGAREFPRPQHSEQLIFGIQYHPKDHISYRAEVFRKTQQSPRPRYESFVDPLNILPELSPDRIVIAPSHAEIRGVELSTAYTQGPYSARLSYTWSQVYDEINGLEVARTWDQTHTINAIVQWRAGPWSASTAVNVHSGWPTTPLLSLPNGTTILGVRNSATEPRYQSLDLRVAYRQEFQRGSLEFALDVANTLNHDNHCCSDLVWSQTPLGAKSLALRESQSWLPRVPAFGVRWEF